MNRILLASSLSLAALIAGCETTRQAADGGQAAEDASATADATTPPLPDGGPAPLDASIDAAQLGPDAGDPPSCGAHGQACCPDGTCGHAALSCSGGLCQGPCGTSGAPCCAGFHCSELQTECDAATRTCVRQSVLAPYALCDDAGSEACPLATVCVPSRLDTRVSPAPFCTADCTDGFPCPGTPLGPTGVCVIAGGGGQCHLPCGGTTECPSGFACRSAPGELGDYWVCVPSDP